MFKIHQQNIETIPNQLTIELCPTYPEQYHPVKGNVLMDHSWKTKVITIILIFLFKCMKNWLAESSPIYSRNGIFLIFMLMQKTFYTKVRGDMWVRNDLNIHICLLTIMYDMTITLWKKFNWHGGQGVEQINVKIHIYIFIGTSTYVYIYTYIHIYKIHIIHI